MGKVGRPKKTIRNPFLFNDSKTGSIRTNVIEVTKKTKKIKSDNGTELFETKLKDYESNSIHISTSLLLHFSKKGVSEAERALFMYILSELTYGREQIKLNHLEVHKITGFSINVVQRTITELIKLNIIRRMKGQGDKYWINPIQIFFGNRISYVKKQSTDEEFKKIVIIKQTKKDQEIIEN